MAKTLVGDIMTKEVVTLAAEEDLSIASNIMNKERIRHLPVTQQGKLVGLVSHRDLLKLQARLLAQLGKQQPGKRFVSVSASDIMNSAVTTVTPDTPAAEAAGALLQNKFGCLPVVQGEKLVGIVTETDFLRWALENM